MTNAFVKLLTAGILILGGYMGVAYIVRNQASGYYADCKTELNLAERYNSAFSDQDYAALDAEYVACVEKNVGDVGLFFYSKKTIVDHINREGLRKQYERGRAS